MSDDPIIVELPDGTELEFPAGTDKSVILAAARKRIGAPPASQQAAAPAAEPQAAQPSFMRRVLHAASTAPGVPGLTLPLYAAMNPEQAPSLGGAVGGTIGGVLGGGVGAVPGAAAGGAAGELMRRVVRREPLDEVTGYGTEAAKQAAFEGVGLAGGAVLNQLGKRIYRGAFPSQKLEALEDEFGDVAGRLLEKGVPVTRQSRVAARAATKASGAKTREMVAAAEAAGAPGITAKEIAPAAGPAMKMARAQELAGASTSAREGLQARLKRVVEAFGGTPGTPATPDRVVTVPRREPVLSRGDEAVLQAEAQLGPAQAGLAPSRLFQPTEPEVRAARQLGASTAGTIPTRVLSGPPVTPPPTQFVTPGRPAVPATPGVMPLTRAQRVKEAAQDMASSAYRSERLGNQINQVDALFSKDLAAKYQKALENRVKGLAEQNAATQALLGESKALRAARVGQPGLERPGLTQMVNQLLVHPTMLSGAGIALNRTGKAAGTVAPNVLRLLESLAREDAVRQLGNESETR